VVTVIFKNERFNMDNVTVRDSQSWAIICAYSAGKFDRAIVAKPNPNHKRRLRVYIERHFGGGKRWKAFIS